MTTYVKYKKVATTEQLIHINNSSHQLGLKNVHDPSLLSAQLNPKGHHLIILRNDYKNLKDQLHYYKQAKVLASFKGSHVPHVFFIDIIDNDYAQLEQLSEKTITDAKVIAGLLESN